ncbi:MAG: hypothetical protein U0325_07970 [Polyangiales bacterium]
MSADIATRPSMLRLVRTLAPGPSPHGAGSVYPTVLRVPVSDYGEFRARVVSRYEDTLKTFWPRAMLVAARSPHPRPISDARLAANFFHSVYATFLTRTLDAEAAQRFAPILDADPGARWLMADLTAMRALAGETLPGLYAAPSRTLLEARDDGDPIVRAIDLDGALLRPGDGPAWELAKLFVAQGCAHASIMAQHPRNHFPYDTVNGVTRGTLPVDHVLRRLLEPHFYVHLALNFGVLYSNRSVARNDQANIYCPFPATEKGQFKLVRVGWRGVADSDVWRPFRFPLGLRTTLGPYGDFGRHYQAVIDRHAARVLADVDPTDPRILQWANGIALHIPGFPDALRIVEPGVLAQTAASIIAAVSLYHAIEHYTYSMIPLVEAPLRLRLAPPRSAAQPAFRYEDLSTRRDAFRQLLAHEMFFKVYPLKLLKDTEYLFDSPALRSHAATFRQELVDASRSLPGREYVPLTMISASLQY